MNTTESRNQYLRLYRKQLAREMEAMGYGQPTRQAELPAESSSKSTGLLMTLATLAVLFLGLSLSSLIS